MLIPVNYFGYKALNNELLKRSKILQEATSTGWQEILSITNQVDYLKQCASYDIILEQMTPSLRKIYGATARVNVFAQLSGKVISSINRVAQIMFMVIVVYQYVHLSTDEITLILYTIIFHLYFSSLSVITSSTLSKRDMKISMDFLNEWKKYTEKNGNIDIDSIDSVEFNISKLQVQDKVLASDISGRFEKGDVVWVRGDSGTGKSTLVKLLPKFRVTDKILINGTDIREITNKSLRHRLRYLSQNVPIIKGTLRDNIFFNKPYDPNIEEKLKQDRILQTILQNKSFDTMITEGGSNLSGGEKQKIAIARVLYDDVDVLVLDKVTSNIDKESAQEILERLLNNHNDKIIFIISHDDLPKEFSNKTINLSLH